MKPDSMVHRFTDSHGMAGPKVNLTRCTRFTRFAKFTRMADFENAARRQHMTPTRADPTGGGAAAARPNDNNVNRVQNNHRLKLNLERHPPLHGRCVPPAKRNTAENCDVC